MDPLSAFEAFGEEKINPFVELSKKCGGDVEKMGALVGDVFSTTKDLLEKAKDTKKPGTWPDQEMLGPISAKMGEIQELQGSSKERDSRDYLMCVAEGIPAFGWVCVEPTPAPYVKDFVGPAMFSGNKIIVKFKNDDDNKFRAEWATAYKTILEGLYEYVKTYHTTGMVWNFGKAGGLPADPVTAKLLAVTQRLEKLASVNGSGNDTAALVARLEAVALSMEGGGSSDDGFKTILEGPLAEFVKLSDEIGGDVQSQAAAVKDAMEMMGKLIETASKCKKPSPWPPTDAAVVKDYSECVMKIGSFAEKVRKGDAAFNQCKSIGEALGAFSWFFVEPAPAPFVKESADAGKFYGQKVMVEFKGKDQKQFDWAKSVETLFGDLYLYIKVNHTTGLSWNPKGEEVKSLF